MTRVRVAFGILAAIFLASAEVQAADTPELVLYTYDSFVAKGGIGPEIFPLFEKHCGCKVRALASGDGGQLLTRLQLDSERGKPTAQLVVGLDEMIFARAKPYLESGAAWKPRDWKKLRPEMTRAHGDDGFYPFDYGYFAFIADTQALKEKNLKAPTSFADLLQSEWKRQLILEDPRTSTPGLAFVLYASEIGQADWKKIRPQWLTLAPGWDAAYGLFLKKEAPLVWSYISSQAYHEEHGDSAGGARRYRALVFKEGNPIQIEGSALVRGAGDEKSKKLARDFIDFLASPEVQNLIPKTQWMLPVRSDTKLPASFKHLPKPTKTIRPPSKPERSAAVLSDWSHSVE